MCRICSDWRDSSTVNTSVEESCQRKKKRWLSWLLNNRASKCWRIVPVAVAESCKRFQKHKMGMWCNVNIASALDFQITCYVQYHLHKVFQSVLMNAEREVPEALLPQPPPLQLFNMLTELLQEMQFWLWLFNLGKTFCWCLKARISKIFSTIVGWFTKDCLNKLLV